MLRLEISDHADADLTEILRHGCATFGDEVGERYFLSFDETFQLLCRYPHIGEVSRVWSGDVRTRVHRSHRLFYRVEAERLFVGRVIHVKRQIDADLFDN
uniref:type II toxin-antitoxin system RelE/ParE family toxin n=1 Tax=uncultured Sphingomonas sp. TaxID=158754 RepID=UPI0035C97679